MEESWKSHGRALELTWLLRQYFPFNPARVKLMARIVFALIKVGTVCQSELAEAFVTKADPASGGNLIRSPVSFCPVVCCRSIFGSRPSP